MEELSVVLPALLTAGLFPAALNVFKLFPTWTPGFELIFPTPLPRKIDLDGRLVTHEPW